MPKDRYQHADFYELLLNAISAPVFVKDREHRLIFVNDELSKLIGFSKDQLLGKSDYDFFPKDQADIFWEKDEQAFNSTSTVENEELITDASGNTHIILTQKSVLKLPKGDPILVGFIYDLTKQRDTERALRENEERLRHITDAAREYIWEVDSDFQYTFVSDQICEALGRTKDEIVGRPFFEFTPEEDIQLLYGWHITTVGKRQPFRDLIYSSLTPYGETIWHRVSGYPIINEVGEFLGYRGTGLNITAQRRAEQDLSVAKERLQLAIDGADLGTWDWYIPTGKIVVNDHWYRMLGYEPLELKEQFNIFMDLLHPDDKQRTQQAIDDHLSGKNKTYGLELRLRSKEGPYKWIYTRGHLAERDNEGNPLRMAGTHLDIHDLKETEEELKQNLAALERARTELQQQANELKIAREQSEAASRAKSEFLANMSHEIRTPMNGVLGMAELLRETDLSQEQKDLVENVLLSGRVLLTVINDILDFSKIEAGKIEIVRKPFNLRTLLRNIEQSFAIQANKKNSNFVFEIRPDVPEFVLGDPVRVQQVLTNLISNSIKFTPPEGAVILLVRTLGENNSTWTLEFTVYDTGIGIAPEKQKRIFEAFEQADGGITREFGGTGLGLAISSQLVSLLGGGLKLRSRPRMGTTFFFSIPIGKADGVNLTESFTEHHIVSYHGKSLNILVAEDNLINQKLIESILAKAGHTVTMVTNGEDVLKHHHASAFDVILMDVQMPVMDGEKATDMIRSSSVRRDVPIIALTAHALRGDQERYLALGMDGYISKPIDRKKLFEEIQRVIST